MLKVTNTLHILCNLFGKITRPNVFKIQWIQKPYTPSKRKNPVCGVDSVVDIKIRGFRQDKSMFTCENLQTVIGYLKTY